MVVPYDYKSCEIAYKNNNVELLNWLEHDDKYHISHKLDHKIS
jgi:hypothetical protein